MRFRNTIEKMEKYLSKKKELSQDEQELLISIRENLEYFPLGTLHRHDLIEYGYESLMVSDASMEALARRTGADFWEQLSGTSIPIIADHFEIYPSVCPLCHQGAMFDNGGWVCKNTNCQTRWSYMKYVHTDITCLPEEYRNNGNGYPSGNNEKPSFYLPIIDYRKYFPCEPEDEMIYHVLTTESSATLDKLKETGYVVEKVGDNKGVKEFGKNAYWVSYFEID